VYFLATGGLVLSKIKKIRDVVYGFIFLDEQECAIINHPVFQRLRRIKQLSLTDMVYPGATHTRFEHSIGVMQMASDMYNNIVLDPDAKGILANLFPDEVGIKRYRKIVRLAALLHDIGHAPFSHAGEDLMPALPKSHKRYKENEAKKYEHEDYSIEIIKKFFKELIENHSINNSYNITVDEVTALLGDSSVRLKKAGLLWKELISGQLDADRADYLLRDSIHLGVSYGLYDRSRLISCVTLAKTETDAPLIAIKDGGWHTAESLVIARYQMFTQVYFHKVRRIYDYHISRACKEILNKEKKNYGCYPPPTKLDDYLKYDDWFMNSKIIAKKAGIFGDIILNREHYKCKYQTQIIPTTADEVELAELESEYSGQEFYLDEAKTAWYKLDKDIMICGKDRVQPLSEKSSIVKSMIEKPCQKRFYVKG